MILHKGHCTNKPHGHANWETKIQTNRYLLLYTMFIQKLFFPLSKYCFYATFFHKIENETFFLKALGKDMAMKRLSKVLISLLNAVGMLLFMFRNDVNSQKSFFLAEIIYEVKVIPSLQVFSL